MPAVEAKKSSENVFEHAPSQAYTHGLEQIYALETVDPSTVRKITISRPAAEESLIAAAPEQDAGTWDGQLLLKLGDEFQSWIRPLFLEEPIQMLQLSQRTETVCIDQGVKRVKDLLNKDFSDWVMNKGIGQGHADEAEQKLKEFIRGRSLERSFSLDSASLIRSLTVGLERKKIAVLLEIYGLSEYFPLSPLEKMESLNLQGQKRQDWIHDAKRELSQEKVRFSLKEMLTRISRVFLSPWIRARGGVVNIHEILERMERIAEEPKSVLKVAKFLREACLIDQHPFTFSLVEVEEGVYCPDRFTAAWYRKICERAQSYFYRENVSYPFHGLKTFLANEFGLDWEAFPDLFVTLTLKRSSLFRVRKGRSGNLEVKLYSSG